MEAAPLLPKMPPSPTPTPRRNRYLVGLFLLLGVVLLWTASNFITADLETGEDSWNKPFLITYLNTSSFAVYLIPKAWKYAQRRRSRSSKRDSSAYQPISQDASSTALRDRSRSRSLSRSPTRPIAPSLAHDVDTEVDEETSLDTLGSAAPLSLRQTIQLAAVWGVFWFVANWSLNASLAWTSVASVTIISSTSGFFTLALGRAFGVEVMSYTKVLAVVASFLGVILVTRSDSTISTTSSPLDLPTHPILGDFAAFISAALYAAYTIVIKVWVPDEDRADMQLVLGLAGLFNIVFLLPVFPLLHMVGWERFELPPSKQAWTICAVNMLITFTSDYLYVLAMLKTTPMLTTIGLSLTIPLAVLGSFFIPHSSAEAITPLSLAGGAMVFAAFAVLGVKGLQESEERDRVESESEIARVDGGSGSGAGAGAGAGVRGVVDEVVSEA